MSPLHWVNEDLTHSHSKVLLKSSILALVLEAIFLTGIGWHEHWLAHPQKTSTDENQFIEAQIYEIPPKSHLIDEKKSPSPPPKPETPLSRIPGHGTPQKHPSTIEEKNQTETGPRMASTHGPVAIYAPSPIIPPYLQDKELKTSIIFEFFVNAQGHATPHLVQSTGNEELDAIALKSVLKWQFRPAEKDNKPLESKVRLRILFEVK